MLNTTVVLPDQVARRELDQLKQELGKVWEYVKSLEARIELGETTSPPAPFKSGKVKEYVDRLEAGHAEGGASHSRRKKGS